MVIVSPLSTATFPFQMAIHGFNMGVTTCYCKCGDNPPSSEKKISISSGRGFPEWRCTDPFHGKQTTSYPRVDVLNVLLYFRFKMGDIPAIARLVYQRVNGLMGPWLRYEGGSYRVKIVIGAEFPLQPPRAVRRLHGLGGFGGLQWKTPRFQRSYGTTILETVSMCGVI